MLQLKDFSLGLFFLLFLSSCFFKADKQPSSPTDKKISPQSYTNSKEARSQNPLLARPEVKEWESIWKKKNKLTALKNFQKKHGLFLPTLEKQELSLDHDPDAPCGPVFISLVKNSKALKHLILEIDSEGKVLNQWRLPSSLLLTTDKNSITVIGKLYESSLDFSLESLNKEPIHLAALKVDLEQNIHILNFNIKESQNEQFKTVPCPKKLETKSKGAYYCLEKQNPKDKRLYALEYPCT